MKYLRGLIALILLLVTCTEARSTLLLMVFNRDTIYMGSDSRTTESLTGHSASNNKIFILDNTCSVALFNVYGGDETNGKHVFIPDTVSNVCKAFRQETNSVENKMTNLLATIKHEYDDYYSKRKPSVVADYALGVYFCGYNSLTQDFFATIYIFRETNNVIVMPCWNSSVKYPFVPLAESNFILKALKGDDARLGSLLPPDFFSTYNDIAVRKPISEQAVVSFMLECFQFTKQYASVFTEDKGLVGGPYVIYRITKTNTTLIHN